MENQLAKNPVPHFAHGLRHLFDAFKWLTQHPFCLFMACMPILIFLLLLGVLGFALISHMGTIIDSITSFLGSWSDWIGGWFLKTIIIIFAPFVIAIASFLGLVLMQGVVSFFFYEYLSRKIEKDLYGDDAPDYPPLWRFKAWFSVFVASLQRALFILAISIAIVFVPFLGFLSLPFLAFSLSWDYSCYALERHRYSFKNQLVFGIKNTWSLMGTGVCLLLPFAQFFLAPLVFVASTIYTVNVLKHDKPSHSAHN